ncbi:MAG: hypothetical protein ACKOZT_14740 [Cyanobium sp.]
MLIDSLRVVLLALSLAMGFATAGQRRGSGLSQRGEWRMVYGARRLRLLRISRR